MYLLSSSAIRVTSEMRELLSVFQRTPLSMQECRRRTIVFGSDLRASVFRKLFQEAVDTGFIVEVGGIGYRLTQEGASSTESNERASEAGSTAIQAKNSSHGPILHRQESQRQIGFWGV